MLLLNAEEVREALPMPAAIEAMRRAFTALAEGRMQVPPRSMLTAPGGRGTILTMPAASAGAGSPTAAVKVVAVFPENKRRGLPTIHGAVIALDPETGRPAALLEGASLTAVRTGAVSGLATDLLAREDSRALAVFGSGVQARTQAEAVCCVRPIETLWICNPSAGKAERMADEIAGRAPFPADVRPTTSPREALAAAGVVCTATTSETPVFDDADLQPGTHINAVGSYRPRVREIPGETVRRASIVADQREAALEEAGDLIQAIEQGFITPDRIACELGDLLLGAAAGRRSKEQITLFKSVGLAAQDAAAAQAAADAARRRGLGENIAW